MPNSNDTFWIDSLSPQLTTGLTSPSEVTDERFSVMTAAYPGHWDKSDGNTVAFQLVFKGFEETCGRLDRCQMSVEGEALSEIEKHDVCDYLRSEGVTIETTQWDEDRAEYVSVAHPVSFPQFVSSAQSELAVAAVSQSLAQIRETETLRAEIESLKAQLQKERLQKDVRASLDRLPLPYQQSFQSVCRINQLRPDDVLTSAALLHPGQPLTGAMLTAAVADRLAIRTKVELAQKGLSGLPLEGRAEDTLNPEANAYAVRFETTIEGKVLLQQFFHAHPEHEALLTPTARLAVKDLTTELDDDLSDRMSDVAWTNDVIAVIDKYDLRQTDVLAQYLMVKDAAPQGQDTALTQMNAAALTLTDNVNDELKATLGIEDAYALGSTSAEDFSLSKDARLAQDVRNVLSAYPEKYDELSDQTKIVLKETLDLQIFKDIEYARKPAGLRR